MKKKSNQREVTQKLRKGQLSFLHATRHLDLIHIEGDQPFGMLHTVLTSYTFAMKFHQDIPYGYLVMVCTRIV